MIHPEEWSDRVMREQEEELQREWRARELAAHMTERKARVERLLPPRRALVRAWEEWQQVEVARAASKP